MNKEKSITFLTITLGVLCVALLIYLGVSYQQFETQQAMTEATEEAKVFHDPRRNVTCYWHLRPNAETCFPDSLIRLTQQ